MLPAMQGMSRDERLQLMRFVCSFAWADLRIEGSEREWIGRLVRRLEFEEPERNQVEQWLKLPPKPDEVDPNQIPPEHRELFLSAARAVVTADGQVSSAEAESLQLLEELLGTD